MDKIRHMKRTTRIIGVDFIIVGESANEWRGGVGDGNERHDRTSEGAAQMSEVTTAMKEW